MTTTSLAPNPFAKLDPAVVVGATRLAAMFERSRWWAQRLMREWWSEQQRGGPVRVFKRTSRPRRGRSVRSFGYYTTTAIVDQVMRRPDKAVERRLRALEEDVGRAYARIAELERKMGARR